MELFDTHCHIQSSGKTTGSAGEEATRLRWERAGYPAGDELIARATAHGVTRMICVGCTTADSRLAVEFVQERENCWAAVGIHPHEAKDHLTVSAQAEFASLVDAGKVVAIGECGLDYYYEHSPPADQADVLRFQIELAFMHDLPVIFHVREAFDDFWPIFDEYVLSGKVPRGVLHSFTDTTENLQKALDRGLHIGVNGIVTFAKNEQQLRMYKNIPLSRLLLETDAPFLTPSPWRGTICEPYHTSVTAEFLGTLRGVTLEQLAAATTVNARKLFNL